MMFKQFIPVCLLIASSSCSQHEITPASADNGITDSLVVACYVDTPKAEEPICIFYCEPYPQFPGGEEALAAFLKQNLHYPEEALRQQKSGTVFVGFNIDEKGKLSDFEVKSRRIGFGLEEEALRVLKLMPEWEPGLQNGKPSAVRFNLPVRFAYAE